MAWCWVCCIAFAYTANFYHKRISCFRYEPKFPVNTHTPTHIYTHTLSLALSSWLQAKCSKFQNESAQTDSKQNKENNQTCYEV